MWEEDASDDDSELVGQPVAWTMPGAPPIKRQPLAAKDAGSAAADSEAARREREARLFLPQKNYNADNLKNTALGHMALPELEKLLHTQLHLCSNKELLDRLPDKGAKLKRRLDELEDAVARRRETVSEMGRNAPPSAPPSLAAMAASLVVQERPPVGDAPRMAPDATTASAATAASSAAPLSPRRGPSNQPSSSPHTPAGPSRRPDPSAPGASAVDALAENLQKMSLSQCSAEVRHRILTEPPVASAPFDKDAPRTKSISLVEVFELEAARRKREKERMEERARQLFAREKAAFVPPPMASIPLAPGSYREAADDDDDLDSDDNDE